MLPSRPRKRVPLTFCRHTLAENECLITITGFNYKKKSQLQFFLFFCHLDGEAVDASRQFIKNSLKCQYSASMTYCRSTNNTFHNLVCIIDPRAKTRLGAALMRRKYLHHFIGFTECQRG